MAILIVDDEEAFGEIGQLILERAGFQVQRATSAVEAMSIIEQDMPELILSDVEMPQMDGFELLRHLRSNIRYQDLPFILMSARRTYPNDRVQGLNLGGDDYISKPFSGDELVSRVNAILRRSGKTPPFLPEGVAASNASHPSASAPPLPASPVPASSSALAHETVAILAELQQRILHRESLAVLYVDLSFFRGYNECRGYDRGDDILRYTLRILEQAGRSVGEGQDLVSHMGADKFMVLSHPSRAGLICHTALNAFVQGITDFYSPEDQERGFIEGKSRQGDSVAYPFINLVIGVVSNQHRALSHLGHFSQVGAELLRYAKSLGGSRFVVDRRRDAPLPLRG